MSVANTTLPLVTDADLAATIAPGSGVVAVDFTADWCPPCRMMAPVLDAASQTFAGKAKFVAIDSDVSPQATVKYNVRGLPTLLVFKDGELVDRIVGAVPLATVHDRIAKVLP